MWRTNHGGVIEKGGLSTGAPAPRSQGTPPKAMVSIGSINSEVRASAHGLIDAIDRFYARPSTSRAGAVLDAKVRMVKALGGHIDLRRIADELEAGK